MLTLDNPCCMFCFKTDCNNTVKSIFCETFILYYFCLAVFITSDVCFINRSSLNKASGIEVHLQFKIIDS